MTPGSVTQKFATSERDVLQGLAREEAAAAFPRLSNPSTQLELVDQKIMATGRVRVTFTQTDRYDYVYEGGRAPTPAEPQFVQERYLRTADFAMADGAWQLTTMTAEAGIRPEIEPQARFTSTYQPGPASEAGPGEGVNPESEAGGFAAATQSSSRSLGASVGGQTAAATRSRARFRDYAVKHATSYNRNYKDFDGWFSGGDCTNFVSQALHAAGFTKYQWGKSPKSNAVWWYTHTGSDTWSNSWTVATNFYWFSRNSRRATLVNSFNKLTYGDAININFNPGKDDTLDHTLAVTGKSSGRLYVSSHTNDYANKRMSDVVAQNRDAWFSRLHFRYS